MTTVLLGLGRETLAWLDREAAREAARDRADDGGGGRAATTRVVVLDERPAPLDPARWPALTVRAVGPVDLDDAPGVVAAVDAALDGDPFDAVVRSPGVSPYRAGVVALATRAPVVTPTAAWLAEARPAELVAVTGTKGKSTTAAMVAHLLGALGRRVVLAGNIGAPLVAVDPDAPRDDLVVELSSYQLADLTLARPAAVAAVTTLFVDHVPWHGSVARYHADKLRLLDLALERVVSPQVAGMPVTAGRVDAVAPPPTDAVRRALASAGLRGEHAAADAMLALAVVARRVPDADPDVLVAALAAFAPLPHRLRPIATVAGRRYVDDSIATVPEAALAALAAYRPLGPVTLLLGGDDRGQPLEALVAALADPDVRAALMPPLGTRLADALAAEGVDPTRLHRAEDLADAVAWAHAVTPEGGSVLLSPAAPSLGQFRDFVERGERFAALVADLEDARGR